MLTAPIPIDEAERLADLRALNILDTPPEERFDRIVDLTAQILDMPIAYIALIDSDRQWFKAKCGVTTDETGRDISFCGHAILHDEPFVVPDARADERFSDNPLVVGEPFIRFYAGHPLAGPGGHNVGTLCVADREPRSLDERKLQQFRQLAALAEHELGMMELIQAQHALIETKNELVRARQRLADELTEAAVYVRSLLPRALAGDIRTQWRFITSSQLGGDLLGYHWLDPRQLAIYLLDVCGHGVSAALLSISIFNDLRRQTLPETPFDDPAAVLRSLNRAFPMNVHGQKFFTIWYGVYDTDSRELHYASAGHPPAILLDPSQRPIRLGRPNIPIGVREDTTFDAGRHTVGPHNRLFLFSDGAYEVLTPEGRMLMLDGFVDVLTRCSAAPACPDCVVEQARQFQGSAEFKDDFSLLEVTFV